MRLLKLAVVLLSAVGLTFAVWQWTRLQRSETAFDAVRRAPEGLDTSLREREADAVQRAAFEEPRNARMHALPTSPARTGATAKMGNSDPSPAAATDSAKRAELRQRYLQAYRGSLESTFALLFQRLHLTPDQQSKLLDLLQQREANNLRVEDAAREKGVDDTDSEIGALDNSLSHANKAAMIELLGRAGEREVHAFLQDQAVLPQMDEFVAAVGGAGIPMTTEQTAALLQTLANASGRKPSGRVIDGSIDWATAQAKAAPLLTADQLSVFQMVRQEQENNQKVEQMVTAMTGH